MLARELSMTHAELLARMSTAEFAEWIAYYRWEQAEQKKASKKGSKSGKPRPGVQKED